MLREFDWDKYSSETSFTDIRNSSPDLSSRRLPSMFSPDKKLLYLSSEDIDVKTDNETELQQVFERIKSSYKTIISHGKIDHSRAYIARTDFIAVCELLAGCSNDPDQYADPDELLASTSA